LVRSDKPSGRKKVLVGNQWLSEEPNEIDISVGFQKLKIHS
jgi:hypothetical protein